MSVKCQSNVSQVTDKCQHSIGKVSIGKVSIDKNNMSGKPDDFSSSSSETTAKVKEIVLYLNEKLGTKYRSNSKTTAKHINARLKEGYTVSDFKAVIDKMFSAWKNTEMEQYLTPETLFGTKFEKYLNRTDKTSAESKAEQVIKDKYQAVYDWANEGDEVDEAGILSDCDDDRCYLPDFSAT